MAATRRLAVIMFTDTVGYSAATQLDEAATLQRLQEQEELLRPLFKEYRGREIKSTGDGFLVEFDSALKATHCAIEIQRRMHERNSRSGVATMELRIGIHLGDVEQRGDDIFGDAVNIAARVEPQADPGGVCISEQVFDQVRNKIPNALEKLPTKNLKNLLFPVDIYRVALPWQHPPAQVQSSGPTRLAVLPLTNISPDPKDEYFADGLTEELISILSQIRGLRVIARTSVSQYNATSKTVSQIGGELGVGSVLEGSVRKAGNRIRITLQLIDVASQEHTWSASYNRELDDIFAIQAEVAERTASVLRVELLKSDREAIAKKPTSSLEAYELYLRGNHALRSVTDETDAEEISRAISCFEQAIRTDPDFSLAYSALADVVVEGSNALEPISPSEGTRRARQLVTRALELDPTSSRAHTALANLARAADLDWTLAEAEYRKGIALNPSDSHAHFGYGMLLRTLLRFGEAKEELRITVELDPFESFSVAWQSETHIRLGELDAAIALARRSLALWPSHRWPHIVLGWCFAADGRWEDVRKEALAAREPLVPWMRLLRATLFAMVGEADEARVLLKEWEGESRPKYVSTTWVAALCSLLGSKERAISLLEQDLRQGGKNLAADHSWEYYDPIRTDPRFVAMLRAMNLPTDVTWHRAVPKA